MRNLKRSFVLLMSLCVSIMTFSPCNAEDGLEYLGEFCFKMNTNGETDPERSLKLDLFYSNGHYPVHGAIVWEPYRFITPMYGTAMKDGEDIILTLTGTHHQGETDTITVHAVIGIKGGEYNTIEHGDRWTASETFLVSFSDNGSLTPFTCPDANVGPLED